VYCALHAFVLLFVTKCNSGIYYIAALTQGVQLPSSSVSGILSVFWKIRTNDPLMVSKDFFHICRMPSDSGKPLCKLSFMCRVTCLVIFAKF